MYAIIETGGKQYRVKEGDILRVEKLPFEPGETLEFDSVLLVRDGDDVKIGSPMLSEAHVSAKVLAQDKSEGSLGSRPPTFGHGECQTRMIEVRLRIRRLIFWVMTAKTLDHPESTNMMIQSRPSRATVRNTP
jgi:ribosomal protein L21